MKKLLYCLLVTVFLSGLAQKQADRPGSGSDAALVEAKAVPSCSALTRDDALAAVVQNSATEPKWQALLASVVTGIGAGIYEELVFRLILICALMIVFQDVLHLNHENSIIASVLVSAVLFRAHHHIIFLNGQFIRSSPFNWTEFSFRIIAGVYFAVVFAIRGFAITAGTHGFYDIIAVCINVLFAQR